MDDRMEREREGEESPSAAGSVVNQRANTVFTVSEDRTGQDSDQ